MSLLQFILAFCLPLFPSVDITNTVPVMKINFYLMGREEIDQSITLQIGHNVEYLNQEFDGQIKFVLNELFINNNHAYMPDIYQSALGHDDLDIDSLVRPVETSGAINVFLFDTYMAHENKGTLMGFTPILSQNQDSYRNISPYFDRIFMAYSGLRDQSTLIHEMGHFLGLSHPWEMNHIDLDMMGLTTEESQVHNHMTYNESVSEFTPQQLDRMQHFALTFRDYLLSHVEYFAYHQQN